MFRLISKTVLVSVFCISLLFITSTKGLAQNGYCTEVKVLQASAKIAGNAVYLYNTRDDCGNFAQNEGLWFNLDPANEDAMLAVALTIIAVNGTATIVSKISNVYGNWGTLVTLAASPPE